MRGLELCEAFYRAHGEPMLQKAFAPLLPYLATGLVGSGSECLGYDDALSRDHDFEPGFCIFLPDEDTVSRRDAFLLERAYEKLPRCFEGFERSRLSPVGGNRHGVLRLREFLEARTGTPDGVLTLDRLCRLPEQPLLELTAGRVFYDGLGTLTAVRERLRYFPEDVRRKKLAGELVLLGQAGQYNLPRCIERSDEGAARLCLFETVRHAMHLAFLLDRAYMPYYKWQLRALRELPRLASLAEPLTELLGGTALASACERVDTLCETLLSFVREEYELPHAVSADLAGYAVERYIDDPTLRNAHILFAVD